MDNSKLFELKMPKFLLAAEPSQMPSGFHYIYSPHYLSLVLIIRERTQQVILNNYEESHRSYTTTMIMSNSDW